ncbi:ribokinase [Luteimonas sp. MJ293]|uniref:ribokinase n=1 Tax=Luteimonas sp. MJ146 TaxID=3129240 RepID=UPI0031B9BED3
MSSARVAVVGSFNVDHVWHAPRLPRPGETLAGEYATGPGGKGFNQAVAARRAGAETSFICALGDDAGGALARELAATDGIDLHVLLADAPTGTAGIYTDAAGRNSIVIGPGANAALDAAFVQAQEAALRAARVVLAQLESPPASILAALQSVRAGGGMAMLNPAPANAPVGAELLAASDLITPNETEFSALLQAHSHGAVDPTSIAGLQPEALHALCRALLPHGSVVVTLGEMGAFVSHPPDRLLGDVDSHYRVPAERVATVDTTGAGDAFNGSLAAGLASGDGQPFARHVRFAACFAALSTERAGAAASMPFAGQVRQRFQMQAG